METTFDPWLRALRDAEKGPVVLTQATRGKAWEHAVAMAGDWSGSTMRGEVRSYPDAEGDPLATFVVSGPVIADGYSTFTLSLAAGNGENSTGNLPADSDADGIERFPFDLLITPSGEEEELLFGGFLPIRGRITE